MTLAPNDFTHLHVHSEFSLLDGLGRITEMVEQAPTHGFDSLGADRPRRAVRRGRLLPGLPRTPDQADHRRRDLRRPPLDGRPRGQGGRPALPPDPAGQGLARLPEPVPHRHRRPPRRLLLQAAHRPRVPRPARRGPHRPLGLPQRRGAARAGGGRLAGRAPRRRVPRHPRARATSSSRCRTTACPSSAGSTSSCSAWGRRWASRSSRPTTSTTSASEQAEAHDVLLCVQHRVEPRHARPDALRDNEFYLKSRRDGGASSGDMPDAISNTRLIAEMTTSNLPSASCACPTSRCPTATPSSPGCAKECERGLRERYGDGHRALQHRLDYELEVIIRMGYAAYFLIVADFTRFAREQGIATTCRGSAPGSIVTYTLGITPVDPLAYELPFERFLNPDRVTMPDIDVDFEDARRDEVIRYVTHKYGDDHVAQIITFGTMLAPGGHPRRRPRAGPRLRRGGPGRQGGPQRAGIKLDEALETRRRCARCMAADPGRAPAHRPREAAGGRGAQRLDARRRRRHQPRAADRDHAAPARDQLGRADDPVRDARRARRWACSSSTSWASSTSRSCARPSSWSATTAASTSTSTTCPSTTPGRSSCWAPGETTGIFQLESPGMRRYVKELRPTSVSSTWRRWSPCSGPARWTTSRPTSGASTARNR
jgi:DNA polymerase III subunit alpha